MGRTSSLVVAVVWWAACGGGGDDDAVGDDAGVDAAPDASAPPCERIEPVPPDARACPEGWSQDATGYGCSPWPDGAPAGDCGQDEAHFPGDAGCARIGTACAADDEWATDLPEDADVLYVQAGAGAGGDGTRDNPFGSITFALARARGGEVIALSKGTFEEGVVVAEEVTLWGACVAETIVTGGENVALAMGADATARNLTVRGSSYALVSDHDVTLEGVRVLDGVDVGVVVLAGTLTAHELIVRGPGSAIDYNIALDVFQGGSAELERTSVEGYNAGIHVYEAGTRFVARDTVIRDVEPDVNGEFGFGVQVSNEATATLERVAVESCHGTGLYIVEEGTHVDATDLFVARTNVVERDGTGGYGVALGYDATAEITGATLVENRWGAAISEGAVATMTGLAIASSLRSGLVVEEEGALTASDVVIADTTDAGGMFGHGIGVATGGTLVLTRAIVENNQTWGIAVQGNGATATMDATDVVIRGVALRGDGVIGRGLEVLNEADVTLHHVTIASSHEIGLSSLSGSRLEAYDVLVEGTESNAEGTLGLGVLVAFDSSATLTCAEVRGNRVGGVVAEMGSTVTLEAVIVEGTRTAACDPEGCPSGGFGFAALNGAHLVATSFQVFDSALAGVQVALEGEMDLHQGEVLRNPVGANVQDETFELARLQDDVLYDDNGKNYDSAVVPLPDIDLELPESDP